MSNGDSRISRRFRVNPDGLLYKVIVKPKRPELLALVVPEALRAFLLTRYHSLPISGHKGRHKTTYAIQLRYYWPRMDRDITRWIRA